ncbi:MAG: hypothetical protein IJK84_03710 [Bacteroidales bacterium]|nr:hypothetical protein [Bacteroidales bacterium]
MKILRFSLLLVLLLILSGSVWGQSNVSVIQENESDTTIVRYWQEDICVVYTCISEFQDKYFLLVDESSPSVLRITVPQEVTVNDFRILHDSVYVGGNHVDGTGYQRGLLACFDIQDFYNGSGNYNWMVMMPTTMPDCYGGCFNNQVYDVARLALYDDMLGGTKIAYIGRNYVVGETSRRVGIGCASYSSGSGGWQNIIIYNKSMEEEYTDIIATQNNVVAVGKGIPLSLPAQLIVRIFPKISFLTPTWHPAFGVSGAWADYYITTGQMFTDLRVDNNVMATALDVDEFAVAFHFIDGLQEGLAVKTFGIAGGLASVLQGMNAIVVRQPGSKWKMRDIRYSPTMRNLVVLNDFDGGGVGSQESIVYQFPISALPTGTYYGSYLPGYDLHALDIYGAGSNAFVVSGNNAVRGLLALYREALAASLSCGQQDALYGKKTSASSTTTYMSTNMNEPFPFFSVWPFVVQEIERDVLCDQP